MPAPPGLGGGFEASGRWARGCRAGKKQTESVWRRANPPLVEGPTPAEHVAFAASVVGQAGAALGFSAIEVSCMIGGISGWLSTGLGEWCWRPPWTTLGVKQHDPEAPANAWCWEPARGREAWSAECGGGSAGPPCGVSASHCGAQQYQHGSQDRGQCGMKSTAQATSVLQTGTARASQCELKSTAQATSVLQPGTARASAECGEGSAGPPGGVSDSTGSKTEDSAR